MFVKQTESLSGYRLFFHKLYFFTLSWWSGQISRDYFRTLAIIYAFLGHRAPLLKHFGSMQYYVVGKTWNISKSQLSRHSRLISLYLRAAEPHVCPFTYYICTLYKYILLTTRSPSFCAFNTRQAILVCFHSNSSLSHGIEAQSVCTYSSMYQKNCEKYVHTCGFLIIKHMLAALASHCAICKLYHFHSKLFIFVYLFG